MDVDFARASPIRDGGAVDVRIIGYAGVLLIQTHLHCRLAGAVQACWRALHVVLGAIRVCKPQNRAEHVQRGGVQPGAVACTLRGAVEEGFHFFAHAHLVAVAVGCVPDKELVRRTVVGHAGEVEGGLVELNGREVVGERGADLWHVQIAVKGEPVATVCDPDCFGAGPSRAVKARVAEATANVGMQREHHLVIGRVCSGDVFDVHVADTRVGRQLKGDPWDLRDVIAARPRCWVVVVRFLLGILLVEWFKDTALQNGERPSAPRRRGGGERGGRERRRRRTGW